MSEKAKDIIISITFLLIIMLVLILNIIKKDDIISQSERRKLEQLPEFSFSTLINGTFFSRFEKYTTDQFLLRESLRNIKARIDLCFKKNYHDIYLNEDYLIEQLYPLSQDSINNMVDKISYIKEHYFNENKNIYFSIIPDKNYFANSKDTPKIDYGLLEQNMKDGLSFANYINIFDILNLDDYYKTDIHWKQESIIKVANTLLEGMNKKTNLHYYKENILTFKGTYAYRLPIKVNDDELNILTNNTVNSAKVYNYFNKTYTGIYNLSNVNKLLDKYDTYLYGSQPLLTIYNTDTENENQLIIFRDSFSSSLAPLLLESYSKITLIDTRYIAPSILANYIDFSDNTCDILFIYSTTIINNSYSLK